MTVFFKDALPQAIDILVKSQEEFTSFRQKTIVVRDIYGRLRFAVNVDPTTNFKDDTKQTQDYIDYLSSFSDEFGPYKSDPLVVTRSDFMNPDMVFNSPEVGKYSTDKGDIRLMDRLITGQQWIKYNSDDDSSKDSQKAVIPCILFHGLKGGVGRSTALAMTAFHLAQSGKRVLVLDLDLESPGLSGILTAEDNRSEFGIIDWLIERNVGQEELVFNNITIRSLLSTDLDGEIILAAAYGADEDIYVSKLSRIYGELFQSNNKTENLAQKLEILLSKLEQKHKPDCILIDSRSGLHDLAAIGMVNLATDILLFGTNSFQSWQGYRQLFTYWRSYPEFIKKQREKLSMVYALFPETEQTQRFEQFKSDSFNIFSEFLYDQQPGIEKNNEQKNIDDDPEFAFSESDDTAPHYPALVNWNNRFVEFSSNLISNNIINEETINTAFRSLFERIDTFFETIKNQ